MKFNKNIGPGNAPVDRAEEGMMNPEFNGGQKRKVCFAGILAFIFCVELVLLFVTAGFTYAGEVQEVPDEIYIDNTIYKADRKGSVYFSHTEHAEGYVDACNACHHEYKDGQNVWQEGQPVRKCSSCHDPLKRNGNVRKLNIAYHLECKGCHKKVAKEGSTKAPYRQCTDCHAKR